MGKALSLIPSIMGREWEGENNNTCLERWLSG